MRGELGSEMSGQAQQEALWCVATVDTELQSHSGHSEGLGDGLNPKGPMDWRGAGSRD